LWNAYVAGTHILALTCVGSNTAGTRRPEHKTHIPAKSLQIPYQLYISDKHNLYFPGAVQILFSGKDNTEVKIRCGVSFVRGYDRL
jgi:hypothetical protein